MGSPDAVFDADVKGCCGLGEMEKLPEAVDSICATEAEPLPGRAGRAVGAGRQDGAGRAQHDAQRVRCQTSAVPGKRYQAARKRRRIGFASRLRACAQRALGLCTQGGKLKPLGVEALAATVAMFRG